MAVFNLWSVRRAVASAICLAALAATIGGQPVLDKPARTWVETEAAPAFAGLWWVHAAALCVGLVLLVRESAPGALRFRLRAP